MTVKNKKPRKHPSYDSLVITRFKNDPAFLRTCIRKSFEDYMGTGNKTYFLETLKQAVKAHGASELARKTGLNRQYIYEMVSERSNPTVVTFSAFLKAFGMEIDLRAI